MAAANGMPAAKKIKLDFSEDITVLVGADEKRFTVHKGVIIRHSTFFRTACSSGFKEGREGTIRLPEADVNIFSIYIQWAYSGELAVLNSEEAAADKSTSTHKKRLGMLYVLADQLGDTLLRNNIINALIESFNASYSGPGGSLISCAYEHTAEGSTLRRLVREWHLSAALAHDIEKYKDLLPRDFIVDLAIGWAKAQHNRKVFKLPTKKDRCAYHEHSDEIPKCA